MDQDDTLANMDDAPSGAHRRWTGCKRSDCRPRVTALMTDRIVRPQISKLKPGSKLLNID